MKNSFFKKTIIIFLLFSIISNAQNNYDKGNEFLKQGDNISALIEFTAGILLNPYDWRLFQARAYTRELSGNFIEALKDVNQALELNPKHLNIKSLSTRARIYQKKGDFLKALEDYNYLIEYFPNDFQTKIGIFHLDRGKCLLYTNNKNEACLDFVESRKRRMADAHHFIDKFCN